MPDFSLLKLAPKCLKVARPQLFGYISTFDEVDFYADKLFEQLRAGVKVHIHKIFSLEQIPLAHEQLENRLTTGKLLVKF